MVSEKESSQLFDSLLFPKIFQTFRMAIQPTKLIIAFLAVAIICLAGWIMDLSRTVEKGEVIELQKNMTDPDQDKPYIDNLDQTGGRTGVFSTLWHFGSIKFHAALKELFELNLTSVGRNIVDYFKAIGWAVRYHFVYCIIFVLIKLAVISVAGGAICRIAALQFAQGEKPGLTEALRFSTKRFTSFFIAPLTPVGIIIFIGLFIFLLGLIGNIPRAGELIMGIFMLLALIAGALIAIVLIGAVAGFNLMFPSVAYDGSDGFDAISRSFSYVYAKPWRMLFYSAIAAVYGAICYTFVRFFASLLFSVTYWFLKLGVLGDNSQLTAIWPGSSFTRLVGPLDLSAPNWTQSVAILLIYLSLLVVIGLVVSFIISFYFSANTIIYSLMRNKVDNTALEDIYTPPDEVETEPGTTESKPERTQPQPESEAQSDSPP
ncbi:MAG: hypothetical protein ACYS9C_17375 [Planctomycetota bacterium]|jgi:hypothetical protein